MTLHRAERTFRTKAEGDIIDLTPWLVESISASGMKQGIACVMVKHSTAAVTLIENEPGLRKDLSVALARIGPQDAEYEHDATWGDGNGRSHVRSTVLGQSVSISFNEGHPDLGTWQQLVLMELDTRGRERHALIQLVGE